MAGAPQEHLETVFLMLLQDSNKKSDTVTGTESELQNHRPAGHLPGNRETDTSPLGTLQPGKATQDVEHRVTLSLTED
ncbi:hypothetical protein P7K49_025029 [Saguinus oedipus]|uniref:Uncharacterized protein n=1 Tax=Saguinus oedipus TaxID=9490 RepID=A0ABQ9UGT4_SAGOE|nr:hypothetical protein P7K49_025029 [Saguinus oedipus]